MKPGQGFTTHHVAVFKQHLHNRMKLITVSSCNAYSAVSCLTLLKLTVKFTTDLLETEQTRNIYIEPKFEMKTFHFCFIISGFGQK